MRELRISNYDLLACVTRHLSGVHIESPTTRLLRAKLLHIRGVLRLHYDTDDIRVLQRFSYTCSMKEWVEEMVSETAARTLPPEVMEEATIPYYALWKASPAISTVVGPLLSTAKDLSDTIEEQKKDVRRAFFVARNPNEMQITTHNVAALFPELHLQDIDILNMALEAGVRQSEFKL
jgi:hypothetical protein